MLPPCNGHLHTASDDVLTPRQREIAQLIARGFSNALITQQLVITPGTTANHVAAILQRLGLQSRTDVAVWAVQQGVLGGEDRLLAKLDETLAQMKKDGTLDAISRKWLFIPLPPEL